MEQQQSANNKSLSPASATSVSTSLTSITAHRRKRLVRSDNVMTTSNNSNNSSIGGSGSGGGGHHNSLRSVGMHYGWESLFRESLLHMAWPISLSMSQEDGNPSSPRNLMIDFLPLKVR